MVSINRPSVYLVLLNCLIGFRSLSIQSLGQSIYLRSKRRSVQMVSRPSVYLLLLNCLIGFRSLSIHSLGQSICHSISLFHPSVRPAVVCLSICHSILFISFTLTSICQFVSFTPTSIYLSICLSVSVPYVLSLFL